jgi:GT2 family glycosyltransferase
MEGKQKITILTVTYNQLKQLKKLYASLVKQKKYVKEWIVYDDRSKDETIDWLEDLSPAFPLKIIRGKERPKPLVVANMNECIKKMGSGPFMLVFADTYLDDKALKHLSDTYIPNSFGSAFKVNVDEKGNVISNHYKLEEDKIYCMMQTPTPWNQFSGNGMIATKEIMERINYIDEEYSGYGIDDYDTAMRAMMNGALLFIYANVKLYHIDHPTKESTQDNLKRYNDKMEGGEYKL